MSIESKAEEELRKAKRKTEETAEEIKETAEEEASKAKRKTEEVGEEAKEKL